MLDSHLFTHEFMKVNGVLSQTCFHYFRIFDKSMTADEIRSATYSEIKTGGSGKILYVP